MILSSSKEKVEIAHGHLIEISKRSKKVPVLQEKNIIKATHHIDPRKSQNLNAWLSIKRETKVDKRSKWKKGNYLKIAAKKRCIDSVFDRMNRRISQRNFEVMEKSTGDCLRLGFGDLVTMEKGLEIWWRWKTRRMREKREYLGNLFGIRKIKRLFCVISYTQFLFNHFFS